MLVELRAVPDCPNLAGTRELLRACLAEAGIDIAIVERIGDFPSPSVLIDGRDVTGADPDGPAACVLRPPTADQIRAALRESGRSRSADLGPPVGLTASATQCCPPGGGAIRTDRPQRASALPAAVRAVHRQLLRHFAGTGAAPSSAVLADFAAEAGLDSQAALRRLAEDDLVALDDEGSLLAVYPFSPTPTPHVVEVDGVRMYAMCAIDALGVPAMLGRDATIASTDPSTGRSIVVTVRAGQAVFDPHETVVVYAATGTGNRSVDTCCSTINFFGSPASGQAWLDEHAGLTATILDQGSALALGRDIFGPLLA
jgi:hypothetical protein